ncbi:MAG: hypothetical protein ACLRMZ_19720 [Blautia marasmi]
MGIRPTSITIADEIDFDAEFTVDVFENLGDERLSASVSWRIF